MTLLDGQIGARGDAPRHCMKACACWCLQRTPAQPERWRRMVGSIQSAKNTGDCMKYTISTFYLPVLFPYLLDLAPKIVLHADVSESRTQGFTSF
jgi:hypothetical protein